MENYEKLAILMENEEFVSKLQAAETDKDAVALFAAEGLDVDIDEFKKMMAELSKDAELSEDDAEKVAGGVLGAITFFGGLAIKYAWGMTPGNTYQEKTKFIVDGWKKILK